MSTPPRDRVSLRARTSTTLSLATIFWNLAITPEQQRQEALAEIMAKSFDDEPDDVRAAFQGTAAMMIERHRLMFPARSEVGKPEQP